MRSWTSNLSRRQRAIVKEARESLRKDGLLDQRAISTALLYAWTGQKSVGELVDETYRRTHKWTDDWADPTPKEFDDMGRCSSPPWLAGRTRHETAAMSFGEMYRLELIWRRTATERLIR
ncbi:MAG: hypothetical protein KDJ45_08830 [Hyphomicrobiaceae bacterium]|nr:hypothetical protein [Hyphomicrobiaceae bacterium]MCC0009772.1 hypothetical protein [Hyphomicrobiaceae bacterium]